MKIFRIIFFVVCAPILCSFNCDETGTGLGTGAHYPEKPYRFYPYDTSINNSRTPVFSWRCEEEDPDFESTLTYDVYFKRADDTGPLYIYESDEKSLQCPITLDPETEYELWVKAVTRDELRATSNIKLFTTGTGFNNPPHYPQIIVPTGYNPISEDPPSYPPNLTFSWTCHDPDGDDLTYDVLLKNKLTSGEWSEYEAISEGQTATQYQPTSLEYNTYYIVMIVVHDAETELPSLQRSFWTDDGDEYHGIYAELTIHRSQWGTSDNWTRNDYVSARFDSVYAPDGPIVPKRPTAVYVGTEAGWVLQWQDFQYYYSNPYVGYFLGRGASYFLTITGGDDVPSLVTDSIILPKCRLEITSPEAFSWISMDEGFELVWIEYDDACPDCDRDITIRIMDMGPIEWTDVNIVTENDGSYTFTADDLSGIDPAAYSFQIVLIIDNKKIIIAPGYDPRS